MSSISCGLARPHSLVGGKPTQVAVSHGPGIEPCRYPGNPAQAGLTVKALSPDKTVMQKSVSGNGNSVLIPDRQRENKEAKLFFHYHPEAVVNGDFTLPAVAPIIRVMNRSLGIDIKR